MKNTLTETIFKQVLPEGIYSEANEDLFFGGLVSEGPEFLAGLTKCIFKREGETSPYNLNDFVVEYAKAPNLVFLRIQILNMKYTQIRRVYILFKIKRRAAIKRAYYLTIEDSEGKFICGRVAHNGTFWICDCAIHDEDDETDLIAHDYLKLWKAK